MLIPESNRRHVGCGRRRIGDVEDSPGAEVAEDVTADQVRKPGTAIDIATRDRVPTSDARNRRQALAGSSTSRMTVRCQCTLEAAPAVVATRVTTIDLLYRALWPTSPTQRSPVVRSKLQRHGIAKPDREDLRAVRGTGAVRDTACYRERIVERNAVEKRAGTEVDIDAQHLAEQRRQELCIADGGVLIVTAAAVTDPEVEKSVASEARCCRRCDSLPACRSRARSARTRGRGSVPPSGVRNSVQTRNQSRARIVVRIEKEHARIRRESSG